MSARPGMQLIGESTSSDGRGGVQVRILPFRPGGSQPRASQSYNRKEVVTLTTEQQALNAANKRPSARTAAEQRDVDNCSNLQSVRNADFEAKRQERIHGPARR